MSSSTLYRPCPYHADNFEGRLSGTVFQSQKILDDRSIVIFCSALPPQASPNISTSAVPSLVLSGNQRRSSSIPLCGISSTGFIPNCHLLTVISLCLYRTDSSMIYLISLAYCSLSLSMLSRLLIMVAFYLLCVKKCGAMFN